MSPGNEHFPLTPLPHPGLSASRSPAALSPDGDAGYHLPLSQCVDRPMVDREWNSRKIPKIYILA